MTPAQRRSLISLVLIVLLVGGAAEWWRARQAAQLGREIAALARPGDILMISSVSCPFCEQARRWLTVQQVAFGECFIERDAACAERYRALGAQGTPTMWVRGQAQRGFAPQQVLDRLQSAPAGGAG
jgi:glutaredoxin